MTDSPDLTPDAARSALEELESRHVKRGQKKITEALEDAADVVRDGAP